MNLLDLAIFAAFGLAALVGWSTGLLRPGLVWLAVGPGLFAAVRLLPWVLEEVGPQAAGWHPLAYPLGVSAGVLAAGVLVGHIVGYTLGRLLHLALPGPLRKADSTAGLVVAAAVLGTVVWLLAPTAAATPGGLGQQAAGSSLVQLSLDVLPAPPKGLDQVVAWVNLERG